MLDVGVVVHALADLLDLMLGGERFTHSFDVFHYLSGNGFIIFHGLVEFVLLQLGVMECLIRSLDEGSMVKIENPLLVFVHVVFFSEISKF